MDEELIASPSILIQSENGIIKQRPFKETFLRKVFTDPNYEPIQEVTVYGTINYIEIDPTLKFSLISDSDGNVSIYEIQEEGKGSLKFLDRRQYIPLTAHKSQWYPLDNGMFNATYPNKVVLVDTNTLKPLDTYDFELKKVYGSDWNTLNPYLIAVGTSGSTIRFIDIRSGSSLQQITVESLLGSSSHNVTRVLWSTIDEECLFAGDSSGYIHIFDIRKPRKSLQTVGSDNTICEPVVCLAFTCDNMNLISGHGLNNRLTQWTFKNRVLVNRNINYPFPYTRLSKNKFSSANAASAFLKCQIHVTESLLFKPITGGTFGGEICVYDLKNGERLRTLSPTTWNPDNCTNVNCVTGLYRDYPILFSGSKRFIRIWGLSNKNDEDKTINELHADDWSD